MEQNSKQKDKIVELYNNISVSTTFHDQALANLKKAEKEHVNMKDNHKVTYVGELRRQKHTVRNMVAAGIVIAVVVAGTLVYLSDGSSSDKKSVAMMPEQPTQVVLPTESITEGNDPIIQPEVIDDKNQEADTTTENPVEQEQESTINISIANAIAIIDDGKMGATLYERALGGENYLLEHETKDGIESFTMYAKAENSVSTGAVLEACTADGNIKYLCLGAVDETYEACMDSIYVPVTNMTYEVENQADFITLNFYDAEHTLRGVFTYDEKGWYMDDGAMIQIAAINVADAYFSGDIEKVKQLVQSDDIIVSPKDVRDTMSPYLIKYLPEYVSRDEAFGVSVQFYAPEDIDSYSYLALEMKYVDGEYVVLSMGLEK